MADVLTCLFANFAAVWLSCPTVVVGASKRGAAKAGGALQVGGCMCVCLCVCWPVSNCGGASRCDALRERVVWYIKTRRLKSSDREGNRSRSSGYDVIGTMGYCRKFEVPGGRHDHSKPKFGTGPTHAVPLLLRDRECDGALFVKTNRRWLTTKVCICSLPS